jgi:hypothetical protein
MDVPGWQVHHSSIFQTNEVKWSEVYRSWTLLFIREQWTDDQVTEAVLRVAMRPELPRFPPEHLQAIRSELNAQIRQDRELRERAYEGTKCVTCDSTGWVLGLPELSQIVDGRWAPKLGDTHKTVAVTCRCIRGRGRKDGIRQHWSKDPLKAGMCLMDLDEYTMKNPGYREQMEILEEVRRAERVKADGEGTSVNREKLDLVRKKLIARFQIK